VSATVKSMLAGVGALGVASMGADVAAESDQASVVELRKRGRDHCAVDAGGGRAASSVRLSVTAGLGHAVALAAEDQRREIPWPLRSDCPGRLMTCTASSTPVQVAARVDAQ